LDCNQRSAFRPASHAPRSTRSPRQTYGLGTQRRASSPYDIEALAQLVRQTSSNAHLSSAPARARCSASRPCEAVPALVAIEERPCLHGVLSSRTLQSRNNVAILRLNSWFRFGPRFSPHRAGYILEALNFSNPTERKCLPLFCRGFRNDFRDRRSFVSASRSPHGFATACAPERHLVLQGKINAQPARQVVVGSRSKGPISSGFYWFRTPAS
jgi:hypothetical protein